MWLNLYLWTTWAFYVGMALAAWRSIAKGAKRDGFYLAYFGGVACLGTYLLFEAY